MWEGGSGWGIHVNPWLIQVNVWQKPVQYCKVISLQLIKINGKKNKVLVLFLICSSFVIFFPSLPSLSSGFLPLLYSLAFISLSFLRVYRSLPR